MSAHFFTFSSTFPPPPSARHYNSDLSLWLSVDPMADKYPGVSPYVYCGNNPVVLKDPDGREWYINEDGYIKVGKNEDDHNIYFVKGHKKDFGEYQVKSNNDIVKIDIGKDITQPIIKESGKYKYKEEIRPYTSDLFNISDEKVAQNLFRQISRYTDVEWSFWRDEGGIHLSTSHITDIEIIGPQYAGNSANKGELQYYFHTHPRREALGAFSNTIDTTTYQKWKGSNPKLVFGIMHRGILYDGSILTPFRINWDGTRVNY